MDIISYNEAKRKCKILDLYKLKYEDGTPLLVTDFLQKTLANNGKFVANVSGSEFWEEADEYAQSFLDKRPGTNNIYSRDVLPLVLASQMSYYAYCDFISCGTLSSLGPTYRAVQICAGATMFTTGAVVELKFMLARKEVDTAVLIGIANVTPIE